MLGIGESATTLG